MYVHLGANCIIRSDSIIAIFNLKEQNDFYKTFAANYQKHYEVVKLAENEDFYSCILTDDKIYLSAISALTIKKRAEDGFFTLNEANGEHV